MSGDTKNVETKPDNRFVRIAAKLKVIAEQLREDTFKLIESDSIAEAFANIEQMRKLDTCYQLCLRAGMEAVEKAKASAGVAAAEKIQNKNQLKVVESK
jgi:hypothetical protein